MIVERVNDLSVLALAVEAWISDLLVAAAHIGRAGLFLEALACVKVKVHVLGALDAQGTRKRSA